MALNFGIGLLMIPVILFMFLLPIALLVALQVWLCRKNGMLGLILPGLSLALSLMLVFPMVVFSAANVSTGGGTIQVTDGNGTVIQEEQHPTPETKQKLEVSPRILAAAGVVFLVANIPTAVFGSIWLHYKGRRDTLEDLKRMQIEDLE